MKPEILRLNLDWNKAYSWYTKNPFQVDIKLKEYAPLVSKVWVEDIFGHDKSCKQMLQSLRKYENQESLHKDLKEVTLFFFKQTIFGLLKYCYESTGDWIDPVKQDSIYRFAWFHFVITNELDSAYHSWVRGEAGKYLLTSCPPQHGKAQPLDEIVYKPEGETRIRDLKLGDLIDNGTGGYSRVIKLHDINVRPIYKLTFLDGREVEAADDHNWEVKINSDTTSKVVTTLEAIELLASGNTIHTPNYILPKEDYDKRLKELEKLDKLTSRLGERYLSGNTIGDTASKKEAIGLAESIRAIGGYAKVTTTEVTSSSGEVTLRYSLNLSVTRMNGFDSKIGLQLKSISYVGSKEARCISVDSPRNLYATRGYVVTHNSSIYAGGLIPMILGNTPTAKGIIGTYNASYGASLLQKDMMATVNTDGYTQLFGKIFNKNMDQIAKRRLATKGKTPPKDTAQQKDTTRGGRVFAGSLKQLTGNPAQFILVDDPIPNAAVARSPSEMKRIVEEYDASAMSRVRNNTLVSLIATRWGDADPTGYTLKKIAKIKETEKGFNREVVNLCFRAFYDTTDGFEYDFRTHQDQMLWEEVASMAYLNAKHSDALMFNSLYQQSPLSDEIGFIKRQWVNVIPVEAFPKTYKDIIISVDTSYNDKVTSDKAAYGVWGITEEGEYYLLDLFYERCSFLSGVAHLDRFVQKHIDYTAILIEMKTNGQAIYETLNKKYSRIIPVDANESKKARVAAVSPVIQSGKLYLPDTPMGAMVLGQLVEFTGEKGGKDDLVDITSQVIRWYDEQFKFKYTADDILSIASNNSNHASTNSLGMFQTNSSGKSKIGALEDRFKKMNSRGRGNPFGGVCRL